MLCTILFQSVSFRLNNKKSQSQISVSSVVILKKRKYLKENNWSWKAGATHTAKVSFSLRATHILDSEKATALLARRGVQKKKNDYWQSKHKIFTKILNLIIVFSTLSCFFSNRGIAWKLINFNLVKQVYCLLDWTFPNVAMETILNKTENVPINFKG